MNWFPISAGKILSCKRFHSLVKIRKRLDYDTVQRFNDRGEAPANWDEKLKKAVSDLLAYIKKLRA